MFLYKILNFSFLYFFFFLNFLFLMCTFSPSLSFSASGQSIEYYDLSLVNDSFDSNKNNFLYFKLEDVNPSLLEPLKNSRKYPNITEIIDILAFAKKNKDIHGVLLHILEETQIQDTDIYNLIDSIQDFQSEGKKVILYADIIKQYEYLLSLYVDTVFSPKSTTFSLNLPGSFKINFYNKLLSKIGIKTQVIQKRKHKSTWEHLDPNEDTKELREHYTNISTQKKNLWVDLVNKAPRKKYSKLDFESLAALDASNSLFYDQNLKDYGFVDEFVNLHESTEFFLKKYNLYIFDPSAGKSSCSSNILCNAIKTAVLGESDDSYYATSPSSNKLAVVQLTGSYTKDPILSAHIHHKTYEELFKYLINENSVKVVLLRINSGGGDPRTAYLMHDLIKNLASKKPVVTYMENLAYSAAYLSASASDKIIANPFAQTGSIGVAHIRFSYKELFDKLGIKEEIFSSQNYPTIFKPFAKEPLSKEELDKLDAFYEKVYTDFKSNVAQNRNLSMEEVENFAQGKMYIASQALNLKLIDEVMSLREAIKLARSLSKDSLQIVQYPNSYKFQDYILSMLTSLGNFNIPFLRAIYHEITKNSMSASTGNEDLISNKIYDFIGQYNNAFKMNNPILGLFDPFEMNTQELYGNF